MGVGPFFLGLGLGLVLLVLIVGGVLYITPSGDGSGEGLGDDGQSGHGRGGDAASREG